MQLRCRLSSPGLYEAREARLDTGHTLRVFVHKIDVYCFSRCVAHRRCMVRLCGRPSCPKRPKRNGNTKIILSDALPTVEMAIRALSILFEGLRTHT